MEYLKNFIQKRSQITFLIIGFFLFLLKVFGVIEMGYLMIFFIAVFPIAISIIISIFVFFILIMIELFAFLFSLLYTITDMIFSYIKGDNDDNKWG